MSNVLAWLKGKKTYIVAVLFGVYNIGVALGYWSADSDIVTSVNAILAAFGFGFMRAGVNKSGPA